MRLFRSDLYRNLAIGFIVGSGLAMWQVAPQLADEALPAAQAAPIKASAN
jgi:hypothetical protein